MILRFNYTTPQTHTHTYILLYTLKGNILNLKLIVNTLKYTHIGMCGA